MSFDYRPLLQGGWRALLRGAAPMDPPPTLAGVTAPWPSLRDAERFDGYPGQREVVAEIVQTLRARGIGVPRTLDVVLVRWLDDGPFGECERLRSGGARVFVVGMLPPPEFIRTVVHELFHAGDWFPMGGAGRLQREFRAREFVLGLAR